MLTKLLKFEMRAKKISAEVIRSFSIQSSTLQAMSLGQKISKNPTQSPLHMYGLEAFWTAESDISIRFFSFLCSQFCMVYILQTFTLLLLSTVEISAVFTTRSHSYTYLDGHTKTHIPTQKSVAEQFYSFYFCCSTKVCPKRFCMKIIFEKKYQILEKIRQIEGRYALLARM